MIPHCHVSTHLTTQHPLDPLALLSRTNFYLQDTILKGWSEMESKYRLKILKKVYSQVAVQEKVESDNFLGEHSLRFLSR